jgi:hypothetical protein
MEAQGEESQMSKDNIHTDGLTIARKVNKKGSYTASFKVSAIPREPDNEYEREKLFKKAIRAIKR